MKKYLLILLTALIGLSCFACVDNENASTTTPTTVAYDTFIQDSNGVDKCFWEDGSVEFSDYFASGYQNQKSATLTMQTEYGMWYCSNGHVLDLISDNYSIEFEYDEAKIEIKINPDKLNRLLLKILQPCDSEKITTKITGKGLVDKNGKVISPPNTDYITITVSTTE